MDQPTPILTDDELDSVRGGVDVNGYAYCHDRPSGAGLCANGCGNPFIEAIVQGAIRGAAGGCPK